jgi:hypothetical protein
MLKDSSFFSSVTDFIVDTAVYLNTLDEAV